MNHQSNLHTESTRTKVKALSAYQKKKDQEHQFLDVESPSDKDEVEVTETTASNSPTAKTCSRLKKRKLSLKN